MTVSVSPGLAAPGLAPSVIMTPGVTLAPTSDSPRVVMSVEDFYYGTFEGDLSLRKPHPLGIKTSTFTCQICTHLAENNLRWDQRAPVHTWTMWVHVWWSVCSPVCVCVCRLMQHMLQHSELIGGGGGGGDERKCCKFCYRQFSSPAQLQSHQEQVHGPALSSCKNHTW